MSDLTLKQRRAIQALVLVPTIEEAAANSKVASSSIHRWLDQDEDFKIELARQEAMVVKEAARKSSSAALRAIEVLWEIMEDPEATRKERISAADKILNHMPRLRLIGSVEALLAELQEQAQGYVDSSYKVIG